MRLDICVMEKFNIESRNKVQSLIVQGYVSLGKEVITKAGYNVKESEIELLQLKQRDPYVGFGAYKMLKAIEFFDIDVSNKIILDVGSSTGGFTQVLLENAASYVYAVDVGENQLDYRLRQNEQVIVYEKTNIRIVDNSYFTKGHPQFFTVDVSFISLSLILPVLKKLDIPEGVILIKPQFEVGKDIEHFKGFVRKDKDIKKALDKVALYIKETDFEIINIMESPEQHEKKNKEFLAHIKRSKPN